MVSGCHSAFKPAMLRPYINVICHSGEPQLFSFLAVQGTPSTFEFGTAGQCTTLTMIKCLCSVPDRI